MIVYKITNLINNKIYVGIDTNNNPEYLGSSIHLKHLIKEYGTRNFKKETLETCNSMEELREKEIHWIKKLDSSNPDVGYNTYKTHNDKKNINEKLTSVTVDVELFKSFKIKSVQTGITFKQIVSDVLHYFVSSSEYKNIGMGE